MMKKIIFLTLGLALAIISAGCGKQEKEQYNNLLDKCNVGYAMISQSELADYDCEGLGACEWKMLGGKKESFYACCPTDEGELELEDGDGNQVYLKCFRIVD